jgi:4a-hydroxytetrahydrobiopterin dehydratase
VPHAPRVQQVTCRQRPVPQVTTRGSATGLTRITAVYVAGMTERITPRQFHEAVGVDDWRVLYEGACAYFRTGSFATGVALVGAIGSSLATAGATGDHHPRIELRDEGLTVRLTEYETDGLTERHIEMARQISAVARELNVPADPTAVQTVQVTIDALVPPQVMPF